MYNKTLYWQSWSAKYKIEVILHGVYILYMLPQLGIITRGVLCYKDMPLGLGVLLETDHMSNWPKMIQRATERIESRWVAL